MKILSATKFDRVAGKYVKLTPEEIAADKPKLLAQHKIALKKEVFWSVFGGTITIGKNVYQVA